MDDIRCAGAIHGSNDGRLMVQPANVADANRLASLQLEAEEVLKGPCEPRAPSVRRIRNSSTSSTRIRPSLGS